MKAAVLTAITGGYDILNDHQATAGADFYCYTDNEKLVSGTWQIRKARRLFEDDVRNAKIYKVIPDLFLSEYEVILWIDGNIQLKKSVPFLIRKYLQDCDIAVFKHHKREGITEEANICAALGKDKKEILQEQISAYSQDLKLYECPVILRKNNKKTRAFNYAWWAHITRYSRRDQISFTKAAEQAGIKIGLFEGNILDNEIVERANHGNLPPGHRTIKKTSIIIPFKDQADYLQYALEAVYKKTKNYEVILVADAPSRKTKQKLKSIEGIPGEIIYNDKQMGFPYCINQGIEAAKGDYICFLNSDTVVSPGWLEEMRAGFEVLKDAGAIGPLTSYCGKARQMIPPLKNKRFDMTEEDIDRIPYKLKKGYYQEEDITGFCYLTTREVIDTIGVLNDSLFKLGNGEETEYNHRMRELAGFKTYLALGAYVHHYGNITFLAEGIDQKSYNREIRDKWEKHKKVSFYKNNAIIKKITKIQEGGEMVIDKKKVTKKPQKLQNKPGAVTIKRISGEVFHSPKTGLINPGETREFPKHIAEGLLKDYPKDFKRL